MNQTKDESLDRREVGAPTTYSITNTSKYRRGMRKLEQEKDVPLLSRSHGITPNSHSLVSV